MTAKRSFLFFLLAALTMLVLLTTIAMLVFFRVLPEQDKKEKSSECWVDTIGQFIENSQLIESNEMIEDCHSSVISGLRSQIIKLSPIEKALLTEFHSCLHELDHSLNDINQRDAKREKKLKQCGDLLQRGVDQGFKFDSLALSQQLNKKVSQFNHTRPYFKSPTLFNRLPSYELYHDPITQYQRRDRKLISKLRDNLRQYQANQPSSRHLEQHKKQHAKYYQAVQASLTEIRQRLPNFAIEGYVQRFEETTIHHAIAYKNAETLFALAELNQALSILNEGKIPISYEVALKGFWQKLGPLKQHEKLIKNAKQSASIAVQNELKRLYQNYEKAEQVSELILSKELEQQWRLAVTYRDPQQAYFSVKNDEKMVQALKKVMSLIQDWLIYLPDSRLLLDYEAKQPSLVAQHEAAIQEGHHSQRQRIAKATELAKPMTSEKKQNAELQDLVKEVAQQFIQNHQRILSQLVDDNGIRSIETLPLQMTTWSEGYWYENTSIADKNKNTTQQKARFSVVVQDKNKNCHAANLLVEKTGSGTLSIDKFKTVNLIKEYPLDCGAQSQGDATK